VCRKKKQHREAGKPLQPHPVSREYPAWSESGGFLGFWKARNRATVSQSVSKLYPKNDEPRRARPFCRWSADYQRTISDAPTGLCCSCHTLFNHRGCLGAGEAGQSEETLFLFREGKEKDHRWGRTMRESERLARAYNTCCLGAYHAANCGVMAEWCHPRL
jgi:hypothetical protein